MNETSLNFKYKFQENYNPIYTNGAFGGVSPTGEIVINFYLERMPVPYEEIQRINENGQAIEPAQVTNQVQNDLNFIRYVSTGVVMNLASAKAFYQWLGQNIEILENQREG